MNAETMEGLRREMVADINREPNGRAVLEDAHGQVWDTQQLERDFDVLGFVAPFVVVRRKSDGLRGTLVFQHNPRFYYSFVTE